MISTAPVVTKSGKAILSRAMAGETITFTRFEIGNGSVPEGSEFVDMTALSNKIWVETGDSSLNGGIGIGELEKGSNYVTLKGTFNNTQVSASFKWKELGIFCKDEDGIEYLYAYVNDGDKAGYVSTDSGVQVVEDLVLTIAIGDAENVTADISDAGVFATKAELRTHAENESNPHGVTKAQVGLDKVLNLTIEEQAPAYPETEVLDYRINSGETILSVFQKLKSALATLAAHVANVATHTSASERVYWNGKADAVHAHSALDITSGVLPVERGGTGSAEVRPYTHAELDAIMNEE